MTELISKELLIQKFKTLFGEESIITADNDELSITMGEHIFKLAFDEGELDSELSLIVDKGQYFTIIEDQFSFILKDSFSNLTDFNDLDILGEISSTTRVRLKRDKRAYGLLLNNLEFLADKSKFKVGETHTLDEIIHDSILVCEVTFDSNNKITKDKVDYYIDSIRAHLSYSNNIFLENPRETKIKQANIENIITDSLRVNLIKDSEPLTYFLFAESVEHLHLKYLEYYHVLEYYFLHKRIKDVENVIKDLLAIEMTKRISENKQEYYKDLINLFDSYFRKEDKNTTEIDQLGYVIGTDLGYNLLRHALNNSGISLGFLTSDACKLTGTKIRMDKSMFVGRDLLDNADTELTDKFCKQLAERIYAVRNFIVHSKKYEKPKVFIPNVDNLNQLSNEVKLIRVIGYTMLNKAL
ncbi:hypothetical protein P6709_11695 [Jeotgalibacillus sp. ET6]|uniref:hypothetical protein n=1 Tax=Jeotgalibacillus sp. ET6 TaxID=3037260 RepID=UPI00241866E8|nr:hypothetical protein [Jeotgalibacillus sp. ET6]MDG5472408.1 hypothetical protein [Jeotgalibacillus sp. ET6]